MWALIDKMMLFLMSNLVHWYGFKTAVKIKDSLDFHAGGVFYGIVILWIVVYAYIHIDIDRDLGPEAPVVRTKLDGHISFRANPHNVADGVRVLIGFYMLKLFPEKKLRYKGLRNIAIVLYIIALLVLFFGLVSAVWVTPESFERMYHDEKLHHYYLVTPQEEQQEQQQQQPKQP